MKVVVAGGGNIGRYLAEDLATRGHEVTLIERDDEAIARVPAEVVATVLGDACAPPVLERAGVGAAEVVVAATGDDEDNLVVSLLAKQEFAVPHVLARVNHPTNEWLFDESWGVDLAVSPPHLLTALVEEAVTAGDLVPILKLEHGRVELLEARLEERSPAAGHRVEELELPAGCALLAVIRDGHPTPVHATTLLEAGDEVFALVRAEEREAARGCLVGG